MDQLKTQAKEMKDKVKLADKAALEIKNVTYQLEQEKLQAQAAELNIKDLNKTVREGKEKIKSLGDQIGNLDDSLAAAEYRT